MNTETKAPDDERGPVLSILMVLLEQQEQIVVIGSKPEPRTTHLVLPTACMVRL